MLFNEWNIKLWEYEFLNPYWFGFFLLFPLFIYFKRKFKVSAKGDLKFSGYATFQKSLANKRPIYFQRAIYTLYSLIFCLFILVLAKPSHISGYDEYNSHYKNGIDIILAMDISVSMLARDFEPNRLEASKKVAKEFISKRFADRIGLVAYEGEAYTACPGTLDHEMLNKQIDLLQPGLIEDGTAIGVGLGTAVARLRNDSLPSKVIILISDGVNNKGTISPEEASKLAKEKNIRVYTIGIGTIGMAPHPMMTPFGVEYVNMPVEIDEKSLQKIASETGGYYFRATDESSLKKIYKEIDQLEKEKLKAINPSFEPPVRILPFLNWALLCLVSILLIQFIYFKRL